MPAFSLDLLLVPQGPEAAVIRRGLGRADSLGAVVIPIPLGTSSLAQALLLGPGRELFFQGPRNVLVMGLCGSLVPELQTGDLVVIRECCHADHPLTSVALPCDPALTAEIEIGRAHV